MAELSPDYVLFPHTYQVRDYAPKLATRCGRALISDAIGYRITEGGPVFQRQVFQGKLIADVAPLTAGPVFVSFQAGAFRAEALAAGTAPVEIRKPALDAAQIRQRPEAPFRESARAVDLSAALIVAVGRGTAEERRWQALADAIRRAGGVRICDNGWLPTERQVGSSLRPLRRGVSGAGDFGAIQHQVGMGARSAWRSPGSNAPIFEIADYGRLRWCRADCRAEGEVGLLRGCHDRIRSLRSRVGTAGNGGGRTAVGRRRWRTAVGNGAGDANEFEPHRGSGCVQNS